jgi:hypothetical protein
MNVLCKERGGWDLKHLMCSWAAGLCCSQQLLPDECIQGMATVCRTISLANLHMCFPEPYYWRRSSSTPPKSASPYVQEYLGESFYLETSPNKLITWGSCDTLNTLWHQVFSGMLLERCLYPLNVEYYLCIKHLKIHILWLIDSVSFRNWGKEKKNFLFKQCQLAENCEFLSVIISNVKSVKCILAAFVVVCCWHPITNIEN